MITSLCPSVILHSYIYEGTAGIICSEDSSCGVRHLSTIEAFFTKYAERLRATAGSYG